MKKTVPRGGRRATVLFALIVVLLLAAVVLLNAVALVLSNRYPLSVDLTANAAYEIGEQTKRALSSLTRDVSIEVLAKEENFNGEAYLMQARRILERYPQYSSRVKLRYIDYTADPGYAAQHADLTLSEGDIVISANGRVRQLSLSSLFNYSYTATGSLQIQSSRAEEAVTGAILEVLSERQVRVGVLTGNGQQNAESFIAMLVNNNYVLETAVPATDDLSVYDALLLLAPQIDLSGDDVATLDTWLYNNGAYGKTLFYASSVTQPELPNIETFLAEWGVSVDGGAVFETQAGRTYQYQPFYPVADYDSETYRDMLIDGSTPMLMPLARPLSVLFQSRDGRYTETLLSFAGSAGVRPADAGEGFSADDAERWGPIPAMVLSSYRVYENGALDRQSCVVVSGSAAMLEELCLQNSSLANSSYLLGLFNSLTERGQSIAIEPKSLSGRTLGVTSAQVTTLGVALGGVLPLAILLTGAGVWLYRRYK